MCVITVAVKRVCVHATLMGCVVIGCAAMHRVAIGSVAMHCTVFRAISLVTHFLGSWLDCGGGNWVANMAKRHIVARTLSKLLGKL